MEQLSKHQLQQQQRLLVDEKQDILRAMQQAVPSSSWISQQLLAGLALLVGALQQEKTAAIESIKSTSSQELAKERAEKEIEVGKLLQELIEAKMNLAIAANDFEEVREPGEVCDDFIDIIRFPISRRVATHCDNCGGS